MIVIPSVGSWRGWSTGASLIPVITIDAYTSSINDGKSLMPSSQLSIIPSSHISRAVDTTVSFDPIVSNIAHECSGHNSRDPRYYEETH